MIDLWLVFDNLKVNNIVVIKKVVKNIYEKMLGLWYLPLIFPLSNQHMHDTRWIIDDEVFQPKDINPSP